MNATRARRRFTVRNRRGLPLDHVGPTCLGAQDDLVLRRPVPALKLVAQLHRVPSRAVAPQRSEAAPRDHGVLQPVCRRSRNKGQGGNHVALARAVDAGERGELPPLDRDVLAEAEKVGHNEPREPGLVPRSHHQSSSTVTGTTTGTFALASSAPDAASRTWSSTGVERSRLAVTWNVRTAGSIVTVTVPLCGS